MMKNKVVISSLMLLFVSMSYAQSLFDRFENEPKVSSVVVSKSMFNLLSKFEVVVEDDPEARDFVALAKSIESLKVFTTFDKNVSDDMSAEVASYLKKSNLTELMRIKDEQANVKFYIRPGRTDSQVKELLMFVNGFDVKSMDLNLNINGEDRNIESVLLSIVGDIDLDKISSLIAKMNLPEELNQVSQ
jgi:uncharacterized protein YjaZ